MRASVNTLTRFIKDERGVFYPLFAIMAIVLVAFSGSVVDFVRVQQARTKAQIALDSAALALQRDISSTSTSVLRDEAQKLLDERLDNSSLSVTVQTPVVDTNSGTLNLSATLDVPMAFVSLVGVDQMSVGVTSQVTRQQLYLEVAYVLDNSASMSSSSRMTNLKTAANCATNILFYDVSSCSDTTEGKTKADNVKIGVVPFSTFVNVGSQYKTASWMDTTGIAPISADNFDDDDDEDTEFDGPVDRFELYDNIGATWEGCPVAREYPYSVNDEVPTTSNPATLFTPVFNPDEPDDWRSSYSDYLSDSPSACDSSSDSSTTTGTCTCYEWDGKHNGASAGKQCVFEPDGRGDSTTSQDACTCTNYSYSGRHDYYGNYTVYRCDNATGPSGSGNSDNASNLSDRERQERLCKYYDGATMQSSSKGPNSDCVSTPILPLTDDPSSVATTISNMGPEDNTNIHLGTIWGFRVLSPTLPFNEGKSYDESVSKVMIIMTDGSNYFWGSSNMNGSPVVQGYGHLYNAPETSPGDGSKNEDTRLGYSVDSYNDMADVIDKLTVESCDNAKDAGIIVYTIGLSPESGTKTMLENCSSGDGYAFFPDDPSDLNSVFATIAEQLSPLRIEK